MTDQKLIIFSEIDPAWGQPDDAHLHIVLVHPEIPANSGNIARLSAGTNTVLHLVEPLGYKLEDRYLKRAGLDYWPNVTLCVHPDWDSVTALFPRERLCLLSTKGQAPYTDIPHAPPPVLVFGRESRGLEPEIRDALPERLFRIPISDNVRSINLANAVALVLYDVRRRQGFPGMT